MMYLKDNNLFQIKKKNYQKGAIGQLDELFETNGAFSRRLFFSTVL